MAAIERKSHNFHDARQVVADLLQDLPAEAQRPGSIGLLSLDSQLDAPEVLRLLGEQVSFPITGGTSFTYPLTEHANDISAVLSILTLDKLEFALTVSEPLDEKKCREQVKATYADCRAKLPDEPRLLIVLMPHIPGFDTDSFLSALFDEAGNVPVFGGVTTGDLVSTKAHVFAENTAYKDRMVLLALGGDIRPVFAVGSQLTELTQYGPTVTEADGRIVKKVDGMTFCEYMQRLGINPEDRVNGVDALVQYGPLPCRLHHKLEDDDGVPELRCISFTRLKDGSAAFSSRLPVGTRINMGSIQKNDVVESSERCLNEILEKINQRENRDYQYSVLLAVPCIARYFAMLGGENLENTLLAQKIPPELVVNIFYGFCEIGPTQNKNGYHNRSHNASIVMCAL